VLLVGGIAVLARPALGVHIGTGNGSATVGSPPNVSALSWVVDSSNVAVLDSVQLKFGAELAIGSVVAVQVQSDADSTCGNGNEKAQGQGLASVTGSALAAGTPITVSLPTNPAGSLVDCVGVTVIGAVTSTSTSADIEITGLTWNLDSSDFTKVDRVDLTFAAVTNHDAEFTIQIVLKNSGGDTLKDISFNDQAVSSTGATTLQLDLGSSVVAADIASVTVTATETTQTTVTVEQAAGQSDATNSTTINFDVVFNQSVTGFTSGDVTLSGTAGGAITATVSGSGSTYRVAVSGMTTDGTVVVSIGADVIDGGNLASTSSDYIRHGAGHPCKYRLALAMHQRLESPGRRYPLPGSPGLPWDHLENV